MVLSGHPLRRIPCSKRVSGTRDRGWWQVRLGDRRVELGVAPGRSLAPRPFGLSSSIQFGIVPSALLHRLISALLRRFHVSASSSIHGAMRFDAFLAIRRPSGRTRSTRRWTAELLRCRISHAVPSPVMLSSEELDLRARPGRNRAISLSCSRDLARRRVKGDACAPVEADDDA